MKKHWTITVEYNCSLTTEEIWPDGDAPENPTLEDVIKVVQAEGSAKKLIRAWNLDTDAHVSVDGRPVDGM